MNHRKVVGDALTPLGIPLAHKRYNGKAKTYCTFFRYNKQGEEWAEDEELVTGHYIQVDIWSDSDCTDLAEQAEALLVAAGFSRIGGASLYEEDAKTYHESLDFLFEEDV